MFQIFFALLLFTDGIGATSVQVKWTQNRGPRPDHHQKARVARFHYFKNIRQSFRRKFKKEEKSKKRHLFNKFIKKKVE